MKKRSLLIGNKCLFIVALLLVIPLLGISTSAATDQELAEIHAPILYFEGQETCYPVDVSYHIDNSYLYRVGEDTPLSTSPTETELETYSDEESQSVYLDNQKGTVSDDNIITDYQNSANSYETTVYYRVYSDGATKIIQYWMFYAFNKGELNQHEGDWEMVQVSLLGETPNGVMYSQHHGGQKATWEQVEKENNQIKVYVARGSHANYLRSYSGKFGISSDIVGNDGRVIGYNDYQLVELDSQGWLNFSGRWGEFGTDEASVYEASVRGQVGPPGPMYREEGTMWNDPVGWGNSLQTADDTFFLIDWFLYNFITIFIILTAVSLALIGFRIYRRHKKYGLGPRIVSLLYIDGLNLKTIGNIICIVGIIVAIAGLLYPWYNVSADINVGDWGTVGMVDVLSIDGMNGIQINFLDPTTGPVQLGSLLLPFSLLIGVGLVLFVLGTIGISRSPKLGAKYLWRGVKLMVPVLVIMIAIVILSSFALSAIGGIAGDAGGETIADVFNALASSPGGGQESLAIQTGDVSGQINIQWGFGLGGMLLIVAGLMMVIAGIIEIVAKTSFFETKAPEKKLLKTKKPPVDQPPGE